MGERWTVRLEGPISDPGTLVGRAFQGLACVDDSGVVRQFRYADSTAGAGWTAHGNSPLTHKELVSGDHKVWLIVLTPGEPTEHVHRLGVCSTTPHADGCGGWEWACGIPGEAAP